MNNLLVTALSAAYHAGKEILKIYNTEFSVEYKDDKSPLTLADKAGHGIIAEALMATDIPVLSEEGKKTDYDVRKNWSKLWIVDPLDGTKEFIRKNGEFTVNIALVENGKPVLGVIYVPVKDVMYFAEKSIGAYRMTAFSEQSLQIISEEDLVKNSEKLPITLNGKSKRTVVASRSHLSPETEIFINSQKSEFGDVNIVSAGSSLKFCLVAEGLADVYPRYAPTMEWDTAAGQAIAEFSGCTVTEAKNNIALEYNKADLLNPWFVVTR